ncbi:unnamed protein product [Lasius platythorax]|uniref:Uncharacterized protein n=1 Tax=Lasius platythorax TaxID=488582 RepID=A0AAV2NSU0_9HYME
MRLLRESFLPPQSKTFLYSLLLPPLLSWAFLRSKLLLLLLPLLLLLIGYPKFLISVNSGEPGGLFASVVTAGTPICSVVRWWYLILMLYAG